MKKKITLFNVSLCLTKLISSFFLLNLFFINGTLAFQSIDECNVFYEKDGIVVVEVESVPPSEDWVLKASHDGYTGSGYYEWTGPDHFFAGGYGTLSYDIMINTPGTYQFQVRSFNPSNDATEHNDVWVRFPGRETILQNNHKEPAGEWVKVFHYITQDWTWLTLAEGGHKVYVKFDYPGRHTVELSGRSQDFAIDRFTLHNAQEYVATNVSRGQSEMRPCDPNNNAPLVNWVVPYQSYPYGQSFSYTFEDWIIQDPDGDPLAFTALMSNNAPLPNWLQFDGSSRTFSGTPQKANVGTYHMKVRGRDPDGKVGETSFTLSIIDPAENHAPVVVMPIWDNSAEIYRRFEFTFDEGAFQDPDGDELTYSASRSDGSELPAWLTFNAGTRTLEGIPQLEDEGQLHMKITATDPQGASVDEHFIIYVMDKGHDPNDPVAIRKPSIMDQIKLFPNPFREVIYIEPGDNARGKAKVLLYNHTGHILLQEDVVLGSHKLSLDLNKINLSPGLYSLQIILENNDRKAFKILKN
jgi:hypothetical protein